MSAINSIPVETLSGISLIYINITPTVSTKDILSNISKILVTLLNVRININNITARTIGIIISKRSRSDPKFLNCQPP